MPDECFQGDCRSVLRAVTDALDDAIKCVVNGGKSWTQEDYDRWASARERAEEALVEDDPLERDETCPSCCFHGARGSFEGWEGMPPNVKFVVRCPLCEAVHPDQTDTPSPVDD